MKVGEDPGVVPGTPSVDVMLRNAGPAPRRDSSYCPRLPRPRRPPTSSPEDLPRPMPPAKKTGKPLVIVESPAKAKTIGKFLGSGYLIEASIGHVRDLPSSADEIPAAVKKEKWARLGIDVEHDFKPLYVVPKEKREQIKKLKALLKEASILYLATDEDREGESISWHLLQELAPKVPVKRLVFHEITKEAIAAALASPRDIDTALVEAQEARRLVDRLYGYGVSPVLWRKIKPKLSAGRVQSVAVRLVVERERERIRFRTASYWDLEGDFATPKGEGIAARLTELKGRRVATGKDFDPDTGGLRAPSNGNAQDLPVHLKEGDAKALVARLSGRPSRVADLEQKPFTERPAPPFTTSTLQQEASKKLRFAASRTMRAAQRLYENGYITYMRTDSTTLSTEALRAARGLIEREYGREHLPAAPRAYATKVKNAQEAHEAIRPAGSEFRPLREVSEELGDDERKIYELVWRRTVASQMNDARGQRTTVRIDVDDARFQASGSTIEYPGFRLAYVETDAEDAEAAASETARVLPIVAKGEALKTRSITAEGHDTQPPPRLTEAGLIKELEARGIGRPSTYASIIETIQARDYCFKRGTALVPTFTAFAVTNLLDTHLHHLVDYEFTARMEDELDEISMGTKNRLDYLRSFYDGNGKPGLKANIAAADAAAVPQTICRVMEFDAPGGTVEVRVGRYGPFLSQAGGERRASIPDETPPDEMTAERALELLAKGSEGPKSLGKDDATGLEVFSKIGRFGPYVQLGTPEDAGKTGKPKMASLLPGMTPETLTLAEAVSLLRLPREVGRAVPKDATVDLAGKTGDSAGKTGDSADKTGASAGKTGAPKADEGEKPIVAANGRFGPYLKWGTDTRSIPAGESPTTITLARALELFAQPKTGRGGKGRPAAKALKELGAHPKSGAVVKLLDGRYGAYVTDGTTNATVPKGDAVESLTLERALELLEARAALGPPKKRPRGRSRK